MCYKIHLFIWREWWGFRVTWIVDACKLQQLLNVGRWVGEFQPFSDCFLGTFPVSGILDLSLEMSSLYSTFKTHQQPSKAFIKYHVKVKIIIISYNNFLFTFYFSFYNFKSQFLSLIAVVAICHILVNCIKMMNL